MKESLAIAIERKGQTIATLYYPRTGHTIDALYQLAKLITSIGSDWKVLEDDELQLALIKFVESEGGYIDGGFGTPEYEKISEKFPNEFFTKFGNMNNGVISIFPEYTTKLKNCADFKIIVDLDSYVVTNYAIYIYDGLWHLIEVYDENCTEDDLTKLDFDPGNFRMNDCIKIYNRMAKLSRQGIELLKYGEEKCYLIVH